MLSRLVTLLIVCGMAMVVANAKEGALGFPGVGSQKVWIDACVLNTRAGELAQQGKIKDAISTVKQAIAKYPYEAGFYNNLGTWYVQKGDLNQSEAAYRQAIRLSEKYGMKYPDSYLALARLCEKRKAWQDAEKFYKKATTLDGSYESWSDYASFLQLRGRKAESIAARKKADDLNERRRDFVKQFPSK